MSNRRFAPFVFGCLLALLPSLLSAGPWDPNRARPPGFQQTLAYLANDLYDYPQANLSSARTSLLTEDLVAMINKLKSEGHAPSTWEALGQQTVDAYKAQYEGAKTTLRQTKSDPESIITAVEGNQPMSSDLLEDPLVQALILIRWQILGVGERIYQAMLYANGAVAGGGGNPQPPPKASPPKPGKSKDRIDWERMRETRRRAIERRRAFEERLAEEARRRLAEINEIIRYLRNNGSLSENKFKAIRPGAGSGGSVGLAEPAAEPAASAPAESSAPSIEEIEKTEENIEQLAKKIEAAEGAKVEPTKVKVYRGALVFHRPTGLDDPAWQKLKGDIIAINAKVPTLSDMEDKGDEVRWRYKNLTLPQSDGLFEVIPDGEPTEETAEGEPAPKKEEPASTGNGEADRGDEKIIPGTEEKPAKPVPQPTPAKPAPTKPAVVTHDGYWFDPTDESRDDDDPYIYVRANGVANRIQLSKAPAVYGIPDNLTIDQMSWYNERQHKLEKNYNNTHRSPGAQSTNKFAKPKN